MINQFNDVEIKRSADDLSVSYLKNANKRFDPDRDDPADIDENAYHVGLNHWCALNEMRNTVTLSVIAGMYHKFDKALRDKVSTELSNWLSRDVVSPIIWSLSFHHLFQLLDILGVRGDGEVFFEKLDLCRLVVNVYKHGEGDAHDELSSRAPQYYSQNNFPGAPNSPLRHEELNGSEAMFGDFAQAITDFWMSVPERCRVSQLKETPDWLEKKIKVQEKRLGIKRSPN